ncbi:hypothetical protein, partial [Streptosporangium sp. NPDC049644]|uniref:hypothetical protein n=1 Tax=Streptosporangium sp. NPDC049644 TaxID=3155507 RepID=UPI00342A23AE
RRPELAGRHLGLSGKRGRRVTRLEAFLVALASVILPAPKGRHHQLAKAPVPASVSDDTAPFPALTRNPYPQEQNQ